MRPKKLTTKESAPASVSAPIREPSSSASLGVVVAIRAGTAEVFENFWIKDGRADLVAAACPFAKINLPATVVAEREVLILRANEHAAAGTAEELSGFLLRRHLLCHQQSCYGKIGVMVLLLDFLHENGEAVPQLQVQVPDGPIAVEQNPITTGGPTDLMHEAWPTTGDSTWGTPAAIFGG